MPTRTIPPNTREQSFLNYPVHTEPDPLNAHVAILGIPFGRPYRPEGMANDQSRAPGAMRAASRRILLGHDRYNFDLGGTLLEGREIRVVDCGDVAADIRDPDAHYRNAEAMIQKIVAAGAMPIVMGGDHGVTIPVCRGLAGIGPVTLIQIDAHLDWRDAVNGETQGYSSPMRRASEMDHIQGIYQIGLRGVGSAGVAEVEAARAYGARLYTASEVFDRGMEAILAEIPDGGNYYLTLDADGLDPGVMPGTLALAPGGLTYHQAQQLIFGLVGKGRLVGMDVVEIAPENDINQITCIAAGRLMVSLIGAAARAGYFA